jgi:hypothetical protein
MFAIWNPCPETTSTSTPMNHTYFSSFANVPIAHKQSSFYIMFFCT